MYPTTNNTLLFLFINTLILIYSFWLNKKCYKSYCYISIPFLFSLFFYIFYIIVHVYVVFTNNIDLYYIDTSNYKYIGETTILATLVYLCFNLGCTLNILLKNKKHNYKNENFKIFNENKLYKIGLITFLIGAITKLSFFIILGGGNIFKYINNYYSIQLDNASQGGGSFGNYLFFLFVCLDIGSDLLLINFIKNKSHPKTTIIVILTTLLLSFNKRLALIQILTEYSVIVALFSQKIRRYIPLIVVLIIFPLIFSITVGLGLYRENAGNVEHKDVSYTYFVFGNFHNMKAACDGLEYKHIFGPYYGKNIILPIIQKPIPRKIWRNKTFSGASVWTDTMRPGYLETGLSIAPGLIYDAYINFRYLGTLIFFFLVGFFIFKLQNYLYKYMIHNYNCVFYPLVLAIVDSQLILLRGSDISSIFTTLFFFVPTLFIIFYKLRVKIIT